MTSQDIQKNTRLILIEWISTIAIFLGCFVYLAYKIDTQSERTDKLYDVFTCLQKDLSDYRKDADQKFYEMLKEKK